MSDESQMARPPFLRTIGFFNVVFGGFLLVCGAGFLWLLGPFLAETSPFRLDPAQMDAVVVDLRREMIKDAKKDEKNAIDLTSKDQVRKVRERLEAIPETLNGQIDYAKINARLPWISHYLWTDLITGPILNLLMVLSGIVLIFERAWGRKFAIVVLWLKILRLVILSLLLGFVVVPGLRDTVSELARTEFGRSSLKHAINLRNASGIPTPDIEAGEFVQVFAALGYFHAVMSVALGVIYPIVALILLSWSERPSEVDGQ